MGASPIYDVEWVLMIRQYPTPFCDIEGAQSYYDEIISTRWFRNRWPAVVRRGIEVKATKGLFALSDMKTNRISLPYWAMSDMTLLHEVAHFCSARERAEHGQMFLEAYHDLVGRFLGKEAAYCYRHACLAFGLRV